MNIHSFFKSPQNRTGLVIWLGTAITALVQVFLLHQSLSSVDVFGIIVGFIKIIEPETTVTTGELAQVLAEAKLAIKTPSLSDISTLSVDVAKVFQQIK